MSRRPQIHVFFGAPVLSTAPRNPEEENSSSANEKPWRDLHLSFTHDPVHLCSTNLGPVEDRATNDAVWVANSKDHFPVNFEKRGGSVDAFMTDCATSVECVKSFSRKQEVLGESPDAGGSSLCSDISNGNQKGHHVGQQSKKDYPEGNASCIIDNPLDTSPLVFEVKDLQNRVVDHHNPPYLQGEPQGENHNPSYLQGEPQGENHNPSYLQGEPQGENHNPSYLQGEPRCENLLLSQYLKACSQKTDDPKPGNLPDAPSNLDLSTDNEFLSILTLSQVALCSGPYAVGQNEMQNKPIAGEGVELTLPHREDTAKREPLLKSNEDGEMPAKKVDPKCEANSDGSIELFDSDHAGQDNSDFQKCSPISSPVNNKGRDLKPQKRQLCSPKGPHAERSRASDDNVMTSRFTFGDGQLSKRIKLACSPLRPVRITEKTRIPGTGGAQKKLSLLQDCVEKSRKFSVLVVVLHPCHIKEIKTRSSASCKVPLATVVVADQSEVRQKVVLWRAAAFLSLTVFPGDIVLFTGESVKHFPNWGR